jgi:hypothetical protein
MKTIIVILSLLVAGTVISFAQCGKKVVLTTSKTDHLDASGIVTRTVDEKAVVEISQTTLHITVNDDHKMNGTIKSDSCFWKTPFKEGKTFIKATLNTDEGEKKNVTITIESKDGKVTPLFEMEGMPDDRIRVVADKFEEAV